MLNIGEDADQQETSHWWECKIAQPLWKTVSRLLAKPSIPLPYSAAIALDIYPKELKTYPHKNWHAGVWFVLVFFN